MFESSGKYREISQWGVRKILFTRHSNQKVQIQGTYSYIIYITWVSKNLIITIPLG